MKKLFIFLLLPWTLCSCDFKRDYAISGLKPTADIPNQEIRWCRSEINVGANGLVSIPEGSIKKVDLSKIDAFRKLGFTAPGAFLQVPEHQLSHGKVLIDSYSLRDAQDANNSPLKHILVPEFTMFVFNEDGTYFKELPCQNSSHLTSEAVWMSDKIFKAYWPMENEAQYFVTDPDTGQAEPIDTVEVKITKKIRQNSGEFGLISHPSQPLVAIQYCEEYKHRFPDAAWCSRMGVSIAGPKSIKKIYSKKINSGRRLDTGWDADHFYIKESAGIERNRREGDLYFMMNVRDIQGK